MKRFIESSLEKLSIEVGSVSEVRVDEESTLHGYRGTSYEGYEVSVTTIYGKTIVLGFYENKRTAYGLPRQ